MTEELRDKFYRVIIDQPDELVERVSQAIKNGWLPAGGVSNYSAFDRRLMQALYKPSPNA